jgi:hypothetical protein
MRNVRSFDAALLMGGSTRFVRRSSLTIATIPIFV